MGNETRKIPIKWKGLKEEVEIKRLTFGEKNDIDEQATKIRVIGDTPQATVSQKALKEMRLHKGIVKAPFETDIKSIQNLPADLGEMLFREITEFNRFDIKKNSASSGPSE